MKNKKGKKIFNLFKEIILVGSTITLSVGAICLLVPEFYSLLVFLLNLSVNLFGIALVGGTIVLFVTAIGFVTKCIEIKTDYESINSDILDKNSDLMRGQLCVVKQNEAVKSKLLPVEPFKYSYLFDNNYVDTPDLIIDDIDIIPDIEMSFSGDKETRHNTRKKYRGKYLR